MTRKNKTATEENRDDMQEAYGELLEAEDRPISADDQGNGKPRVVKSKRERFLEQAERRTNQALKRLLQVERLGNRSSYEASDEEYTKIISAIRLQVEQIAKSFAGNRVAVHGFRL